jgi:hypothetical protein
MLIYVAISGDRNVIKKEAEKIMKYKQIQHTRNVKTEVTPILIWVTGTILQSLRQYLSNIPGKHEIIRNG